MPDSPFGLPIAVYHEHPDWFKPLFVELDRRGLPWVKLDAASYRYDPAETKHQYSLVVNRASPSAYLRGHRQSTFYTLHWLRHLERPLLMRRHADVDLGTTSRFARQTPPSDVNTHTSKCGVRDPVAPFCIETFHRLICRRGLPLRVLGRDRN